MQLKLKFCVGVALLLVMGFFGRANAQSLRISGKVTTKANGDGLPGASVTVKGTSNGAVTDVNGNYTLTIGQNNATVVVSFVGMVKQERQITTSGVVNFALEDDAAVALTEVVVMGYGTQKITNVSGAISTIKGADIEKLRPVRAEEALQGRASGVTVIQNGSPGSTPTVLIRGIPSFSGTDPIVIIDGCRNR
jgi:hypothetical protein